MSSLKSVVVIVVLCVTCLFESNITTNIQYAQYNFIYIGRYYKSYHIDYNKSTKYIIGLEACKSICSFPFLSSYYNLPYLKLTV